MGQRLEWGAEAAVPDDAQARGGMDCREACEGADKRFNAFLRFKAGDADEEGMRGGIMDKACGVDRYRNDNEGWVDVVGAQHCGHGLAVDMGGCGKGETLPDEGVPDLVAEPVEVSEAGCPADCARAVRAEDAAGKELGAGRADGFVVVDGQEKWNVTEGLKDGG